VVLTTETKIYQTWTKLLINRSTECTKPCGNP